MKCQFCQKPLTDFLAQSICASCGAPQALSSEASLKTVDFFNLFGFSRRFHLDSVELEKRFYQLSRALHPDRFTAASLEIKANSLARMSLVNEAYQALKNAENRRTYLIKLESPSYSLSQVQKAAIPLEMTEAWFELQELIMEDPVNSKTKLEGFQSELNLYNLALGKKMFELETTYDLTPSQAILEMLSKEIQTHSYIKSMEKDLERLKKNAYSN